jgi:membrane protein
MTTLAVSPLSRLSQRWPNTSEWLAAMGRGLARARTLGLAAEVSFWLFLALVPLAAVAGLVAARLIAERGMGDVFAAVPPEARETVAKQVAQVASWKSGHVAPFAVGTFLWLAASGIQSIFDVLEVQAGGSRTWVRKRLLALGTCVALSVGVALLALLGAGLERVEGLLGTTAPGLTQGVAPSIAGAVARAVASLGVGLGMIAGLYRIGVPRRVGAQFPILPGAALATGLVALLGAGYGVYVATMGTGDAYLGGLAAVGVTLMTLWLFSVAILLGAELNRVVYDRRSRRAAGNRGLASPLPD